MPFVTVGRLTQLCAGCDVVCASLGHHRLSQSAGCRDAFSPAMCDDVGPLGSVTWRLLVIRRCWGAVRTRSNVYACCSGMWGAGGSRVAWFGDLNLLRMSPDVPHVEATFRRANNIQHVVNI